MRAIRSIIVVCLIIVVRPAAAQELALSYTAAQAAAGSAVYASTCVTCHGPKGDGDSVAGKALTPPSSDLTNPKLQDAVGDDYLFWHISEGGAALGYNGMTAFKTSLKEEQIWQVIAYVRSLKK